MCACSTAPLTLLPRPHSSHPPAPQLKRTYRTLVSREHPDKGGDPSLFGAIQDAYRVLSDAAKRRDYDATGRVVRAPEEEFVDAFGGGAYRDRAAAAEVAA